MTINDISITKEEQDIIERFISIHETTKKLDKEKKALSEKVKSIFDKYSIPDSLDYNGTSLKVTESVRKTIKESTKDKFINKLISLGKQYLVQTSITIDADSVYSEVQCGTLDADMVKEYMTITSVKTLRCD